LFVIRSILGHFMETPRDALSVVQLACFVEVDETRLQLAVHYLVFSHHVLRLQMQHLRLMIIFTLLIECHLLVNLLFGSIHLFFEHPDG